MMLVQLKCENWSMLVTEKMAWSKNIKKEKPTSKMDRFKGATIRKNR